MRKIFLAGASVALALGLATTAQACCLGPAPATGADQAEEQDPAPLSLQDLHGVQDLFERNVLRAVDQGRITHYDARPALRALDRLRDEEARLADHSRDGELSPNDIRSLYGGVTRLYARTWVREGYF